jgi:hypothetical protein
MVEYREDDRSENEQLKKNDDMYGRSKGSSPVACDPKGLRKGDEIRGHRGFATLEGNMGRAVGLVSREGPTLND